jgi:hypothetical protein
MGIGMDGYILPSRVSIAHYAFIYLFITDSLTVYVTTIIAIVNI